MTASSDIVVAGQDQARAEAAPKQSARLLSPELSNVRLALYSLPSIPIAFLFLPVAMLLPAYYASTLHVSLAAIGGFLLVSRGVDLFLDPMIGRWSDATRSRIGRRRFWMLIGTPVLMIGAYVLFMPPAAPNGWYLLFASFTIYAGGSALGLPYSAWGTEIFATYHGRARMAGFRESAGIFGSLLAASIPAVTAHFGHGVDRFTMGIMGWTIIILTPLAVLIAATFVGEPPAVAHTRTALIPSIVGLFENKPFRLFCGAFILFSMGGSVANATMVFYITDYLRQPAIIGPSLIVLSLATIVGVPAWLWISRRLGKHMAISCSLFVVITIFGAVAIWFKPGEGWWFVGLLAVIGVSSSGLLTLPIGVIGDIIDYDTLTSRQNRGGLYWGIWSFAQKAAPALGIGLTLPILSLLGFHPGGHNSPGALEALKLAYCLGMIPFLAIGAVLLLFFPLNSRRHAIIRRRLEQRASRAHAAGA